MSQLNELRHKFPFPMVRGERIVILGEKPDDFTGLGHTVGDILVRYPDGEEGCIREEHINNVPPEVHIG